MRRPARRSVATAALTLCLTAGATARSAADAVPTSAPAKQAAFWVAGGSQQTFQDMVLKSVGNEPGSIDNAIAVVTSLANTVRAGRNPGLLGSSRTLQQAKSDLSNTLAALRARKAGTPAAQRQQSAVGNRHRRT